MGRTPLFLLTLILNVFIGLGVSDWNILNQLGRKNALGISLKNYCESWRMNVELNNIKQFDVVPEECVDYIGKYMTSIQYKVDSERTLDECTVFLSSSFKLTGDGKDAWIFDIDDTLLSTVPYYKQHNFGGEQMNKSSLEEWMKQKNAPALKNTLKFFNELKSRGLKIFLISSRWEHLRDATTDNLVKVGYYGWSGLVLRGLGDDCGNVQSYKTKQRKLLVDEGYHIWGIVGDQWSSLNGLPGATRTYKLPNSLYKLPNSLYHVA